MARIRIGDCILILNPTPSAIPEEYKGKLGIVIACPWIGVTKRKGIRVRFDDGWCWNVWHDKDIRHIPTKLSPAKRKMLLDILGEETPLYDKS